MNPTDEPSRSSRRSFLRASAAAATALTTSVAGCSSLPPLGTRLSYGRVDVPEVDLPEYRRWLPAQSVVETDDDWLITYAEPGPFDSPVPEEFVARRAHQRAEQDHFGIGYESYDSLTVTNLATVIEAEFTADEVAGTLAETGYEPGGSYRDYDLYARTDVPRRAAVRDGVIVWTSANRHDVPDLEATVDAGAGRVERYHEADDVFASVTEAVGASRFLYVGGSHPGLDPALSELGADAFRIDGDAAYHLLLERYPSEVDPSGDRIKAALEDQRHELTSEAEASDVGVDGRFATVAARIPLAPDREQTSSHHPPQVTWGASFDPDARRVTLRHEAGEDADAELLWYDVVPADGPNEIEKEPLWPDRETVEPGDEATVDLSGRPDAIGVQVEYGTVGVGSQTLFVYPLEGAE